MTDPLDPAGAFLGPLLRNWLDEEYAATDEIFVNARRHGVKCDGVTDDTSALQDLIDATHANGGGTLMLPPGGCVAAVTLRESVILQGTQTVHGYAPTRTGSTRLLSPAKHDGWVVDIVGSRAGIKDLDVWGEFGTTYGGVRVAGHNVKLDEIHFANYLGPAVQVTTGNACSFDSILAFNCLLDRASTTDIGVMDIGGNDHYITRVEANSSLNAISSASARCNAWVIRGTNNFLSNCVGEFSDRGFLVLGSKNRFTGMRADRNFGIGFETRGSANAYAACEAVDNSRGANDTYPAFLTSGQGNSFAACIASYSIANELPTYAFEDTTSNTDAASRNSYAACSGRAFRATFKGDNYLGSSFQVPNHAVRVTAGTTFPVDRSGFQVLSYAAAETITDFTGGHSGQTITVLALNGNATLAHSSTLRLKSGANTTLTANTVYRFARYNGCWYES